MIFTHTLYHLNRLKFTGLASDHFQMAFSRARCLSDFCDVCSNPARISSNFSSVCTRLFFIRFLVHKWRSIPDFTDTFMAACCASNCDRGKITMIFCRNFVAETHITYVSYRKRRSSSENRTTSTNTRTQ